MRRALLVGLFAVSLAGCGVATRVRPVPKGALVVEGSAGGPLVNAGAPIPLPLSSVGAAYGLADRLDVQGHLQLTPLAAFGVWGADVGASYLAREQDAGIPTVTVGLRGYAFTDFKSGLWPYLDASGTASWKLGERWTPFVTLTGMYAAVDRRVLWSPGAGLQVKMGRFDLSTELRWYDPTYRPGGTVVPWIAPSGAGALGLVLGLQYRASERENPNPAPAGAVVLEEHE